MSQTIGDPWAPFKDNAWAEIAEIDARLERGEIDEREWHAAMARLVVPAYLAARTPWAGAGKSGAASDWEYSRSHITHAIDRDGSFLDVGCANGYLVECPVRWTPYRLQVYGLDIAAELVQLARQRFPAWADRFVVGNALTWVAPQRLAYIRTDLGYAPARRRRELFEHLLSQCERLIIGVFNEEAHARPTEELVRWWGYRIAGRSERTNQRKPEMDYRMFWVAEDRVPPIDVEAR